MISTVKAARLLGWTSLAVGATELVATRWLERQMGVNRHGMLIKSYGVREVLAGLTILNQPGLNKTLAAGLWGRVVGDAADLATLAAAAKETGKPQGLAAITSIVVGVTLADLAVAIFAQHELHKATTISQAARQRVQPSSAKPQSGDGVRSAMSF